MDSDGLLIIQIPELRLIIETFIIMIEIGLLMIITIIIKLIM